MFMIISRSPEYVQPILLETNFHNPSSDSLFLASVTDKVCDGSAQNTEWGEAMEWNWKGPESRRWKLP